MKKTFILVSCIFCFLVLFACTDPNKKAGTADETTEFPFLTMTDDGLFNADEIITWREGLKMFELNYKAIYDQTEEKLDTPIIRGEFMDYMVKSFNSSPAIATVTEPIDYSDIAGHPYEYAIDRLSGAQILTETDDGMFHPDEPMTRIEVVVFLANVAKRSREFKDNGESFKDVTPENEYYEIVMNALCGN